MYEKVRITRCRTRLEARELNLDFSSFLGGKARVPAQGARRQQVTS